MHFVSAIYRLALSLWVGGIALFTFVVTPILFRTQGREAAGKIVGTIFPVYFRYGMVLIGMALLARMCFWGGVPRDASMDWDMHDRHRAPSDGIPGVWVDSPDGASQAIGTILRDHVAGRPCSEGIHPVAWDLDGREFRGPSGGSGADRRERSVPLAVNG